MERKIKVRGYSGTQNTAEQPYEVAHRALARRAATECIVLLKNEGNVLPLAKGSKVALYGAGAGHTIKGGTGSGDVNERYSVTIAQGLANANCTITTQAWLDEYDRIFEEERLAWREVIWAKADEAEQTPTALNDAYFSTEFIFPTGPVVTEKTEADVAIFVLARVAGEGADRHAEEGDYFFSKEEAELLASICKAYPKVVVVINGGGQVDLSPVDGFDNVAAILQISQLGCEGGNAFADVIFGDVAPSGKLSNTWSYRYEDFPNALTFSHNNGNVEKEYYTDGIYVGYRYFDSFDVPVRYGFGHGLSYTSFAMEATGISTTAATADKLPQITLKVKVTNTGSVAGKEVAQVYASCPQEKMSKEYRRLVGFAKTDLLAPGASQELEITFDAYNLASYCAKTPGYVLESGSYAIFVGPSLEASKVAAVLNLAANQVLIKTTNICPLQEELEEIVAPAEAIKARRQAALAAAESDSSTLKAELDFTAYTTQVIEYGNDAAKVNPEARAFVDTLTTDQLILLSTGAFLSEKQASSMVGVSSMSVPGAASQTSDCAKEQGLAEIVMADGPAGLRLHQSYFIKDGELVPEPFEKGIQHGFLMRNEVEIEGDEYFQFCTAFPVGTALAQSWNLALVQEFGTAVGVEMQNFLVTAWLAPGMNIHRNPLCGRNFEYFSEDPLLSGRMAGSITTGVQSNPGCGTTIKHFACNNNEDNRFHCDSILSERALREIYLKGFETAIKEAQPMMMMSSYNLINGIHAANNYDTCTKAARDEWGFKGFIMTDWVTTLNDPTCTAADCMRAGNDAVMPGFPSDHESIREALADGSLSMEQFKNCIARQVNIIWQSNMYE